MMSSFCLTLTLAFAVDRDEPVVWSRARAGSLAVLSVGSQEQKVLARSGDDLRNANRDAWNGL